MSKFTESNDLRFFSNSSLIKSKIQNSQVNSTDPVPFGLQLKEEFKNIPAHEQAVTMSPCPTQQPGEAIHALILI